MPKQARTAKTVRKTVSVTYSPVQNGEPVNTKWNGIAFKANVPVELDPDNPAHYVEVPMPVFTTAADGRRVTTHVESKVFMGELARGNPQFLVDGVRARKKVSTRQVPPPGAEWTDENEGIVSYTDDYPDDFDPNAAAIVITSRSKRGSDRGHER